MLRVGLPVSSGLLLADKDVVIRAEETVPLRVVDREPSEVSEDVASWPSDEPLPDPGESD